MDDAECTADLFEFRARTIAELGDDAVRRKISMNWLQSTIDPSVTWAPRAQFTFQILRDGTVTNVQLTQTSGNRSVDNSALRAILSSSPVSSLPSGYSGSSVTVEFWFEFHR